LPVSESPLIVWFRQDLRLADNPALSAAAASGRPLVALYIWDESIETGGAARWWLHGSLEALGAALHKVGMPLVLRRGVAARELDRVMAETGADSVYWNRCYEPAAIRRDRAIKDDLKRRGLTAESFNGALLFEPWEIKTLGGGPFKVFTPFSRAAVKQTPRPPAAAPRKLKSHAHVVSSEDLDTWNLRTTTPDWAQGLRAAWTPGERGAQKRWNDFFGEGIGGYHTARDIPGTVGTSRLSPHLHFGEISVHQLWSECGRVEPTAGVASFQRELLWREFAHHLLFHFPTMPDTPLRFGFADFPWRGDKTLRAAWRKGRTGYPIVDAGMRELWHTGWMHNRVRMIVASFLVKHLLQPWQDGAAWFWDTLVDADLANNSAGWQWVAGCGMDAAPYFRVFNPVLQGGKFDANGAYVRHWVPEIAALPDAYLQAPWEAPPLVLAAAKVKLGGTYPLPIVDHKGARDRALAAFKSIRNSD
jgi:deoxyribodipyrimidine photo-lyase